MCGGACAALFSDVSIADFEMTRDGGRWCAISRKAALCQWSSYEMIACASLQRVPSPHSLTPASERAGIDKRDMVTKLSLPPPASSPSYYTFHGRTYFLARAQFGVGPSSKRLLE